MDELIGGVAEESYPDLRRSLCKRPLCLDCILTYTGLMERSVTESDLHSSYMGASKRRIGQTLPKAPVDLRAYSRRLGSFSFYH